MSGLRQISRTGSSYDELVRKDNRNRSHDDDIHSGTSKRDNKNKDHCLTLSKSCGERESKRGDTCIGCGNSDNAKP
jgi:hypothetical protein